MTFAESFATTGDFSWREVLVGGIGRKVCGGGAGIRWGEVAVYLVFRE